MTTPELLEYVRSQLAAGTPIPTIRQNLLASGGWTEADIAEGFAAAAPSMAALTAPPLHPPPPPAPFPSQPLPSTPLTFQVPAQPISPIETMPKSAPFAAASPVLQPQSQLAGQDLGSAAIPTLEEQSKPVAPFPPAAHPAVNIYANPQNLTTALRHPIVTEPKRSHKGLIVTVIILIILFGAAGAAYAMPSVRAIIITKFQSLEQKFGFGLHAPAQ